MVVGGGFPVHFVFVEESEKVTRLIGVSAWAVGNLNTSVM